MWHSVIEFARTPGNPKPEDVPGGEDYSNRSLARDHFGEECTQDLSWREMEALSGMRPFILATWPNTIAFQSDKHPVSDRGTGRWGLAIRNRYRGTDDCQVTIASQMGRCFACMQTAQSGTFAKDLSPRRCRSFAKRSPLTRLRLTRAMVPEKAEPAFMKESPGIERRDQRVVSDSGNWL